MPARIACLLTAALVALVLAAGPRLIIAQTPEAATRTPTPLAAASGLRIEHECVPDVMRPNEWTAVECVTRYINETEEARPAGRVEIVPGTSGPAVETFLIEARADGELLPVGASPTSFEGEGIPPHQTVESRTILLMNMRADGESRSELRVVSQEGVVAASTPLVFVSDPSAAAPAKELSTSRRFTVVEREGGGQRALYGVTLTNASAVEATELVLSARVEGAAALVEADPSPADSSAAAGVAYWGLASFGKSSLAPGESVTLRAAYEMTAENACGSVTAAAAVKAAVGGADKAYAVAPMNSGWFGECAPPEPGPTPGPSGDGGRGGGQEGGSGGGSVTLPATGQAVGSDAGSMNLEATLLAAMGISLLATGLVEREMLAAGRRISGATGNLSGCRMKSCSQSSARVKRRFG